MKCPTCGTQYSNVLSTRTVQEGTMLQRKRECFNGHRFVTFEVSQRLAETLAEYAETSAQALKRIEELRLRDQAIVLAVRNGALKKDVAKEHGLAASRITQILSHYAPELTRKGRTK